MQGLLLIDKPAGWTSFDVVNYVRNLARQAATNSSQLSVISNQKSQQKTDNRKLTTPLPKVKVGHTGTLDPFATGLLVLLIGKDYTRRAGEFSKLDKTYEVTMRLGEVSTTGDPEGVIQETRKKKQEISKESIEKVLQQFTGVVEQTPPVYSAIKVNGQRAYKLARAGKEVKIEPRKVTIYKLELISYNYPEVKLVAEVSSGTYIRTLVEDIGQALGTGAYTTALRRTQIGSFELSAAHNPHAPHLLEHLRLDD